MFHQVMEYNNHKSFVDVGVIHVGGGDGDYDDGDYWLTLNLELIAGQFVMSWIFSLLFEEGEFNSHFEEIKIRHHP